MKGSFRTVRALLLGALIACSLIACEAGRVVKETGSETHFLRECGEGCGSLSCHCGVCTRPCEAEASCSGLASSVECVGAADHTDGSCGAETAAICDVRCTDDADCRELGSGFSCANGLCRQPLGPVCLRSDPAAAEMVLIGDVMLELTTFSGDLAALARASGSLATSASFRLYASSLDSFLAGDVMSVGLQYDRAKAEGPVSLAVMNGGETDVLNEPCGTAPTVDCAAVQAAAAGAVNLFAEMAADGVGAVVYIYYADPLARAGVKAGLDVLRPLVQAACADAPLPCHFIDLRPVFEGHDEYVGPDGLVWSTAGAVAVADTVWDLMQAECLDW